MDENTYTTKDIAAIFKVSHQAVKTWAREFGLYLSPSAQPEAGKRRIFTDDDVRVFALVREYTQRGYNFTDAHLALKAGQRGDIPDTASEVTPTPPPQLIVALRQEINAINQRVAQERARGDEAIGQVKLLEKLLDQKEQLVRSLYEEIGRLKAKQSPDG
jgi:DNA-binding transcriptional MerR regulator